MRGVKNRVPDEVKRTRGTFRPDRSLPSVSGEALTRWPAAPRGFTDPERLSWRALGKALLPTGTIGTLDLLAVGDLARLRARVDRALGDPDTSAATLTALLSLSNRLMAQLGMNPVARRAVSPLQAAKSGELDPDDEFTV